MANYYTRFSFEISQLTSKETEWFDEKLQAANLSDEEFLRYTDGQRDLDEKEWWPFFAVESSKYGIWFHDDEDGAGDVEVLANFLAAFVAEFRPDQFIGFEWANTCSRPRVDAFSGGAVFITRHGVEFQTTGEFIHSREKRFRQAQPSCVDCRHHAKRRVEPFSEEVARVYCVHPEVDPEREMIIPLGHYQEDRPDVPKYCPLIEKEGGDAKQ